MSTGRNEGLDYPFKAARDMSNAQFQGVSVSADDTVDIPAALANIVGVLQNKPAAANRGATVRIAGQSKVRAGGTIAAGESLTIAVSGWFVKCTSGGAPDGLCIKGAASGYYGEAIILPVRAFTTTSANAQQI